MNNKLFSGLAGIILCSLFLNSPAMARLYKWVDENGVTQYTQTPPPKGDFTDIKPPAKPAVDPAQAKSALDKRLEGFNKRRDDLGKSKAEANKQAAEKAEKTAKCKKARENLAFLQTHARIRSKDRDGKVTMLPEEQRQARIKQANDAIKGYCQ